MRLQALHVPGCPNAAVPEARLAPLLAARPGVAFGSENRCRAVTRARGAGRKLLRW